MTLQLYSFFHLNLAYSAIEETDRPRVIQQCYWPLLRLAKHHQLPLGIELSGYTLETIARIDPNWVRELRALLQANICEFIGCGYAQIIGPLVPAEVTEANLRLGHQVYEHWLGGRPTIALLNEQAYAAGLLPLYREAGYHAIIMEWNNPAREHPDWNPEWRYLPQRACDPEGKSLPLIWNKSIAFQKFQRYAHGELELDELVDYVRSHLSTRVRALPLYGNDAEIFDFRPGRYMTEAPLHKEGEWTRIERLYQALHNDPDMVFIRPSAVLEQLTDPQAGHLLHLQSSAQPTPVKKQDKYHIVRWAVTGRDDLGINTRCWRLFEILNTQTQTSEADWKTLCYLWSSDFRTHITEQRWHDYKQQLTAFETRWIKPPTHQTAQSYAPKTCSASVHNVTPRPANPPRIQHSGRYIQIIGERLSVRLNTRRGLALDQFIDHAVGATPLCGTLHHGYFDDIRWGADYYSGHLVCESPGRAKITDLNPVVPDIQTADHTVTVAAMVATPLGPVDKCWRIDDHQGRLELEIQLHWPEPLIGSLRLAHITLIPEGFDRRNLYYATHNGGRILERFALGASEFNHGDAVSFLVSSRQAIGMTQGIIEIGDPTRRLILRCNKTDSACIGLVSHHRVQDSHFTRVAFSAREVDDTSKPAPLDSVRIRLEINALWS